MATDGNSMSGGATRGGDETFEGIAKVVAARPGARVRAIVVDVGTDVEGGCTAASGNQVASAGPSVALPATATSGRTFTPRWNLQGHGVIASVARDLLLQERPEKGAVLDKIMNEDPYQRGRDNGVADYAQWPDRIKGAKPTDPPGIREFVDLGTRTKIDHYQDFPHELGSQGEAFPAASSGNGRLLDALQQWATALKDETDPAARASALGFVLHLVGDIHQPLHCAALVEAARFPEGDQGGNLIWWGQKSTLHGLWDDALVKKSDDVPATIAEIKADLSREDFAADLAKKDFRAWAEGSWSAAVDVYETFLASSKHIGRTTREGREGEEYEGQWFESPTAEYRKNAHALAVRRAKLAALRLTDLLVSLL